MQKKIKVTSLISKQAWRVYCHFECLIDLLQLLFIDLVWCSVIRCSVYCICEAFLYTCVVFDFCIGLSYVFVSFLEKVNTELIRFFVGNFWSTYISTLNYLFQQMSPGTLCPGRIHFWKWILLRLQFFPFRSIFIYLINN